MGRVVGLGGGVGEVGWVDPVNRRVPGCLSKEMKMGTIRAMATARHGNRRFTTVEVNTYVDAQSDGCRGLVT